MFACCKPERENTQQAVGYKRFKRRYISSQQMDKLPVLENIEEGAVDEEVERRLSDTRHPSL